MAHATLLKFGYPESLIREYEFWCVLTRPAQATLASLVLAARSEALRFSDVGVGAFTELAIVIRDIETSLKRFRQFDRINYLMLMMVDPHVHFHVLPRYRSTQVFNGIEFCDPGWPAQPDLKHSTPLEAVQFRALVQALKSLWP
jgi:diadenosine tetraphosphate (Ap4A) HIT family hydrolase